LFTSLNRSLGEGLGKLLSNQILTGRYIEQQILLTQAELRLLQAQVNPHFLFNALNTISAVIRKDPNQARDLIQHLSQFFRRNLKNNIERVTIKEELAHITSYLEVELARFSDRLEIDFLVDPSVLNVYVPTFTLQPLVENAIKHGTSTLLENGKISITGALIELDNKPHVKLQVIDNAGTYLKGETQSGLGLQIVDKRLKNTFGEGFGLQMSCKKGESTSAEIVFPLVTNPINRES
ncbi:MAG TPA: histidine kinase, partial [Psychromonas sp.]